jgi:hypothetical protein
MGSRSDVQYATKTFQYAVNVGEDRSIVRKHALKKLVVAVELSLKKNIENLVMGGLSNRNTRINSAQAQKKIKKK